jgi:hypothetical protein
MSNHLDSAKLKSLMLTQGKLTEEEETHLSQCPECMKTMVEATLRDIQPDRDKGGPASD